MKKFYLLLIFFAVTVTAFVVGKNDGAADGNGDKICGYSRGERTTEAKAMKGLSREESDAAMAQLEQQWLEQIKAKHSAAVKNKVFTHGSDNMKFDYRIFGAKPADGRSLYISMHGGGSTTASTNDQQWRNQIALYTPSEGVYLAPRAPWDAWNMWFMAGIDEFFEDIIQAAVSTWDVNPDKVYLLGYSAGGDGAYKMSPRMADHWAAASMMAGHPNGTPMVNLRNTPFMIWMGENDSAFNRNTVAAEYGQILDELQTADPEGYIHETHIVAGKGHWMDGEDAKALPWMAKYKRNPYPERIVWSQVDVMRSAFYWLAVDKSKATNGTTVIAKRSGNEITIEKCDYDSLTICLNDEMFDLDRPIIVRYRGSVIKKARVVRNKSTMQKTLAERGDIRYMFPALMQVQLPSQR